MIFSTVVEPDSPGAFMSKHPRSGQNDDSIKIPFLTGVNYDEGLLKSAAFFHHKDLMDNYVGRMDEVLPISLFYDHHDYSVQKSITKQIKDFYFDGELTKDNEMNLTKVIFCLNLPQIEKQKNKITKKFVGIW